MMCLSSSRRREPHLGVNVVRPPRIAPHGAVRASSINRSETHPVSPLRPLSICRFGREPGPVRRQMSSRLAPHLPTRRRADADDFRASRARRTFASQCLQHLPTRNHDYHNKLRVSIGPPLECCCDNSWVALVAGAPAHPAREDLFRFGSSKELIAGLAQPLREHRVSEGDSAHEASVLTSVSREGESFLAARSTMLSCALGAGLLRSRPQDGIALRQTAPVARSR